VGLSNPTSEAGGSAGWGGTRGERIRAILRDEVRRLNPPDANDSLLPSRNNSDFIPTTAKSPTDTSIRLSPEPRFLLLRHWSLYDSMLHSPFLASRLHLWTEPGVKKLKKLLAKMGISLEQCKQYYTHIDIELKRTLHANLLKYAPHYGLEGVVPPSTSSSNPSDLEGWGFVRSWGWRACLSATDVAIIVGSILDVGSSIPSKHHHSSLPTPPTTRDSTPSSPPDPTLIPRFYTAYDALSPPTSTSSSSTSHTLLLSSLPLATHLFRAILRTGTALLKKGQIRHLAAFRMGIVKDGPDVSLFSHPGALVKLALWVGEAVRVQEGKRGNDKKGTPLVLASMVEEKGSYVVVGLGGGGGVDTSSTKKKENVKTPAQKAKADEKQKRKDAKDAKRLERENCRRQAEDNGEEPDSEEDAASDSASESSESESDTDNEGDELAAKRRGYGRNRFGIAFEAVADDMGARVRIDSFEHCVVEVRKEDLGGFLEGLSGRVVVG
jgi:cell division control protein 45